MSSGQYADDAGPVGHRADRGLFRPSSAPPRRRAWLVVPVLMLMQNMPAPWAAAFVRGGGALGAGDAGGDAAGAPCAALNAAIGLALPALLAGLQPAARGCWGRGAAWTRVNTADRPAGPCADAG